MLTAGPLAADFDSLDALTRSAIALFADGLIAFVVVMSFSL
jgi:hypothetical protein